MTALPDDGFDLYDLRVEVIAPEGATLYCGAKPGDYFELRGEMLHLPPGQGMSIYSLAAVLPLLFQRPSSLTDKAVEPTVNRMPTHPVKSFRSFPGTTLVTK